jgi:hypothetical protein
MHDEPRCGSLERHLEGAGDARVLPVLHDSVCAIQLPKRAVTDIDAVRSWVKVRTNLGG